MTDIRKYTIGLLVGLLLTASSVIGGLVLAFHGPVYKEVTHQVPAQIPFTQAFSALSNGQVDVDHATLDKANEVLRVWWKDPAEHGGNPRADAGVPDGYEVKIADTALAVTVPLDVVGTCTAVPTDDGGNARSCSGGLAAEFPEVHNVTVPGPGRLSTGGMIGFVFITVFTGMGALMSIMWCAPALLWAFSERRIAAAQDSGPEVDVSAKRPTLTKA